MRYLLALSCVLALSAHAGPSVALSAAARGHVSSNPPATTSASGVSLVCFWQVPGKLVFYNLAHVNEFSVSDEGMRGFKFRLHRSGHPYSVEIDIPKGTDVMNFPDSIARRIAECGGTPK